MTSDPDGQRPQNAAPIRSWMPRLFFVVALLQLVQIWSAPYFPSCDGPSHVYNASILHELATGHAGVFTRYYQIDWRPHPNWIGHAILAVLLFVVSPVVAEKLLVSAIVLLFLGGSWMLARAVDARGEAYAFLALPFSYHLLLQLGFYNFSISAGLYLVIVAFWWRRRDRPGTATVSATAALLVVCYFSHPVSVALAIGSIGLLWLWSLPGRRMWRHAIHLVALLPALGLLMWFVRAHASPVSLGPKNGGDLFEFLADVRILFFDKHQLELGRWLFGLFILLFIATLIREYVAPPAALRRRDAGGFILIALVFLGLYALAPDSFAGGGSLRERMALFLYLILLPWFSPRLPRWCMASLAIAFSIIALVNAGFLTHQFRKVDRVIADFVRETSAILPENTVLPLIRSRTPDEWAIPVLSHAIEYTAIQKHLIDLDNYEPETGYFPIRYRSGFTDPDIYAIEARAEEVDVEVYATAAQYIVTWEVPPDSPLFARIERRYRLVSRSPRGRVYRSLSSLTDRASRQIILLPLSGSVSPIGGPVGSWFRIDQQIRNIGEAPVNVVLSTCAISACDLDVAPGQTVTIAGRQPYTLVYVSPGEAKGLAFDTVVRRTDSSSLWTPLSIPAVHQGAFQRTAVEIQDVPWSAHIRLNLRVWLFGAPASRRVTVSLRSPAGGQVLAQKSLDLGGGFLSEGDFGREFSGVSGERRVNVRIERDDPSNDGTIWAFLTSSQYESTAVTLHLPKSGV